MKKKISRFAVRFAVLAPILIVLAALPVCFHYEIRRQEIKPQEESMTVAGTVGEGTEVVESIEKETPARGIFPGEASETETGPGEVSETENEPGDASEMKSVPGEVSETESDTETDLEKNLKDKADPETETEILLVDGQRVIRDASSGAVLKMDALDPESETETESESAVHKGGLVNGLIAENKNARGNAESTGKKSPQHPVIYKVAIDPGHQGSWVDMSAPEPVGPGASETKAKATTGTQSPYTGLTEYELNLTISLALRDELIRRGYEVVMTREDNDAAISNKERAELAAAQGAQVLVRIHANGSADPSICGALAMVPSESNPYVARLAADSMRLGQCILDRYCARTPFDNLGIQQHDDMSGINWSQIPVMILEMGFMSNQEDDSRMADPEIQKEMVLGIADGLDEYFEREEQPENGDGSGIMSAGSSAEAFAVPEIAPEDRARVEQALEKIRQDYLQGALAAGEQWSVALMDLNSGANASVNGSERMASASVIKVFLMAAVYDRILYPESEERRIPAAQAYEGELKQLISSMITVSDNEASNALLDRLGQGDGRKGMEVVNTYCREHGYTGTSFGRKFLEANPAGDNFTTAQDCMRILTEIYQGTCVNRIASGEMYELLKQQTRTWKIPAGLSGTGAQTANKTGELFGEYGNVVENDIAIITSGKANYVLAILSGHLRSNDGGQSMIQNLSRAIYESL